MLRTFARLHLWADRHYRIVVAILLVLGVLSFGPWVALHLSHFVGAAALPVFPDAHSCTCRCGCLALVIGDSTRCRTNRASLENPYSGAGPDGALAGCPACWLNSPWFGMVACLLFLMLIARNCGNLYPVVLPLALLIPLPFATDTNLIMWLQRVSSIGASPLLDMAEIRHLMSGNVLELADRRFCRGSLQRHRISVSDAGHCCCLYRLEAFENRCCRSDSGLINRLGRGRKYISNFSRRIFARYGWTGSESWPAARYSWHYNLLPVHSAAVSDRTGAASCSPGSAAAVGWQAKDHVRRFLTHFAHPFLESSYVHGTGVSRRAR